MEQDLEILAKQRVEARMAFVVHLVMYTFAQAGFIAIWWLTGASYPWFMWPLLGWGIGVVAHAVTLWIGPGSKREQEAVEREVHRLRMAPR